MAVKAVHLRSRHHDQRLTVKFSRDVGGSLDSTDLSIVTLGGTPVDVSGFAMTYNPRKHTAQWILSSDVADRLSQGKYVMTLDSAGITDAGGHNLDGNRHRAGTDNFVRLVKVKR